MTVKKADIRGKRIAECPFGLAITKACKCTGDAVTRMIPVNGMEDDQNFNDAVDLEDKKEDIIKDNKMVHYKHKSGKKCIYADTIMEDFDKVNCNFGDTGAGTDTAAFTGSPLYTSMFSGHGTNGIFSFPLGYYADNNESRNLFYGLFSLLGEDTQDQIVKLANNMDSEKGGEFLGSLQKKINLIKENYDEGMKELHKYINERSTEDYDE